MAMTPDTAVVLVAVIGIIVPLATMFFGFFDRRAAAKVVKAAADTAANKVESVRVELAQQTTAVTAQLGTIHELVNSRLTAALSMIVELKALLRERAPDDPRVQALDTGGPGGGQTGALADAQKAATPRRG
jgi:hypothetical protein